MSMLRGVVPVFFLIQFVIVLMALTAAMLSADPESKLPRRRNSAPRNAAH